MCLFGGGTHRHAKVSKIKAATTILTELLRASGNVPKNITFAFDEDAFKQAYERVRAQGTNTALTAKTNDYDLGKALRESSIQ